MLVGIYRTEYLKDRSGYYYSSFSSSYINDYNIDDDNNYKMTFFVTIPLLIDIIPSIEYEPNTDDFMWSISGGKNLFLNIVPIWFNIKNYISNDNKSYNYWELEYGIGLNLYLTELHLSMSSNANQFERLFNLNRTIFNANVSIGF